MNMLFGWSRLVETKSLIEFDNVKYPYSLPDHLPVFLMGHLNIQPLDIALIHVLQMSGAKKTQMHKLF